MRWRLTRHCLGDCCTFKVSGSTLLADNLFLAKLVVEWVISFMNLDYYSSELACFEVIDEEGFQTVLLGAWVWVPWGAATPSCPVAVGIRTRRSRSAATAPRCWPTPFATATPSPTPTAPTPPRCAPPPPRCTTSSCCSRRRRSSPPPYRRASPSAGRVTRSPPPTRPRTRTMTTAAIRFHSDDEDGSDGAHIRFPSDDEDDDAHPHVPRLQPLPPAPPPPPQQVAPPYYSQYAPPLYSHVPGPAYGYGPDMDGYGHGFFNISYARSQPPPPSVSHEHRTQATNATVHYYPGNGASGTPLHGSYYGGYQYRYPNDGGFHEAPASSVDGAAPSPPRVSSWDFFNPFESVESYYREEPAAVAAHTPNRTSKVAQEGGRNPELNNAEVEEVVVKEARSIGNHDSEGDRAALDKDERRSSVGEEPNRKSKSSEASSSTMVHDVHVVEKSVVEDHSDAPAVPGKAYNDDIEVSQEIRSQFEHAANSAANVSKVLEVGKMPYHHKSPALKVSSSMMICGRPSIGEEFLQFVEDKATEHGNLSSTLQKLYMWEKKLLEELKTEEKMRVLYDKKCEELKVLCERGAEAHKLEAIETYTRKLSTKISVAIQVVNTISKKINKLRDEELWPQTNELIQGLMEMWHGMSECHKIQCHALFSEAHIDLIKRLELELWDLVASFAAWVNGQTSYIGTINDLRLGAPPIFIICNDWATGIARIPETGVVDTMQAFASQVLHLWEKHRLEWRQGMMANRDMDRELRVMERDETSMRKALEAQNNKLVLVSNQSGVSLSAQAVRDGDPSSEVGLQSCMSRFFEAMESFSAACANAYKDLHLRCEEERTRPAQETDKVS
ncbi:hypothetical protein ZWY2020_037999 [Hordeum vulgare]|nr:hypothetical protein ZWY2020_037999 [Hordeum vulgare]